MTFSNQTSNIRRNGSRCTIYVPANVQLMLPANTETLNLVCRIVDYSVRLAVEFGMLNGELAITD